VIQLILILSIIIYKGFRALQSKKRCSRRRGREGCIGREFKWNRWKIVCIEISI